MRKEWMVLTALLVFAGFPACVENPKEEIVINKNDGRLGNIIMATA